MVEVNQQPPVVDWTDPSAPQGFLMFRWLSTESQARVMAEPLASRRELFFELLLADLDAAEGIHGDATKNRVG